MDEQELEGKKPEAAPPKLYERGTWLHERDGDLNPTWVFVAVYLCLGVIVCLGALISGSATAIVAALSFLATSIVALLISALPIAKSKVLSRARLSGLGASRNDYSQYGYDYTHSGNDDIMAEGEGD